MAYTQAANKATIKYVKNHQKRISLNIKKTDFENIIQPAIEQSGLPTVTFIKQAIYEKIRRDFGNNQDMNI